MLINVHLQWQISNMSTPHRSQGRGKRGNMNNRRLSPELKERCREMRKNPTEAERVLWERLRDRRLNGHKFRRQHPIGGYVVDFYCIEAYLGIEVDGGVHLNKEQAENDRQRSEDLARMGISILRFWNSEVLADIEGVLNRINERVEERISEIKGEKN